MSRPPSVSWLDQTGGRGWGEELGGGHLQGAVPANGARVMTTTGSGTAAEVPDPPPPPLGLALRPVLRRTWRTADRSARPALRAKRTDTSTFRALSFLWAYIQCWGRKTGGAFQVVHARFRFPSGPALGLGR